MVRSYTKTPNPLKLGCRSHINKTYTGRCVSANQTWACTLSFVANTVSKQSQKRSTHTDTMTPYWVLRVCGWRGGAAVNIMC